MVLISLQSSSTRQGKKLGKMLNNRPLRRYNKQFERDTKPRGTHAVALPVAHRPRGLVPLNGSVETVEKLH